MFNQWSAVKGSQRKIINLAHTCDFNGIKAQS